MSTYEIGPKTDNDTEWVIDFLKERWGSNRMVSRGRMHYPHELKGFVAMSGNKPVGLVTYRIEGSECEIVTLDSVVEGHGIGSGLIGAVKSAAMSAKCHRIWLITTNDNTPALGFYQKRGFALVSVYPNAIEQSRKLKPEIPMVGLDGIPLRDEIELEMPLRHSA